MPLCCLGRRARWRRTAVVSCRTPRARAALSGAAGTAAAAGADAVSDVHLAVALLSEPMGLAAAVIHDLGVTDQHLAEAFPVSPVAGDPEATDAELAGVAFDGTGRAALQGTLKAALRLGHNYIGTEHMLLGVLLANGPAAQTLAALGLTVERVEQSTVAQIARVTGRGAGSSSGS
jgi:ATP-dependent Clp protease ATP-binding subunit ClpA